MNTILDTLLKDKTVKQIARYIKSGDKLNINGLADTLKAAVFVAILQNKPAVIITPNQHSLNLWHEDLKVLLSDMPVKILPELDFLEFDAAAKSLNLYAERIRILDMLERREKTVIIATAAAIVNPVVPPETFQKFRFTVKVDDTLEREEFVSKLTDFGYQRSSEVESVGYFAVRGGIVDVFPINCNAPIRIEFFDNLIETMRIFDIDSKRSSQNTKEITILPVDVPADKSVSLLEYFNDGLVVLDEPKYITENIEQIQAENQEANIITFDILAKGSNIALSVGQYITDTDIQTIDFNSNIILKNPYIQRWIASRHTYRKIPPKSKKNALDFFSDINVGDYVVHETHGIGKFLGVISMEVAGSTRDYVHIQYKGDDKIFLPTDQLDAIHKYIAVGDTVPRLSRLNTADWTRAKSKAKAAVEDIAEKLIDIYARRGDASGFAFAPDDALQIEFEDACEFELTPDQARTLAEVKADMEDNKPMDRLICGDVGFGKTEIAIRAAFKAAMNGKQVAVLVPTTVLAYQHYLTFSKRFENFLPSVDLLSRFRSSSEQTDTLKRLKAGHLDILIGTHAILNTNKVVFKDLGLLIIDEEQRFGVKQKDKFRDLASGVDVLSLSATPIPRSLHMSMVGARDLSVIETAPAERFPVQTYVVEDGDNTITSAIRRELNRKGQVFFVYNRIETIDIMRERLQNLVPDARIMTAHGQMAAELLEKIMIDFYNGAFDILLTTSIIENGLDISNANTLIVYNADYFGLSQLYQLRGRVGRSNRLAFAYFMFHRDKVLTEAAEKRLQAIKDFAQLGSSFNIALRDLQIRGAGNLLGAQQHGHIAGVGFAMYTQLLQDAINKRRGNRSNDNKITDTPAIEDKKETFNPNLSFKVNAFFDDDYIPDAHIKLLFYQRLASLDSAEEIKDFEDELIDRFGQLPPSAQNLVDLALIKSYAKVLRVSSISDSEGYILLQFAPDSKLKPDALRKLNARFKQDLIILPRQQIIKLKITPIIKKALLPSVISILVMLS